MKGRNDMPPKKKSNVMAQRKAEAIQQQKKQKTRRIIWFSTIGVVLLGLIIVLVFQTRDKADAFDYNNLPRLGAADAKVKIVDFSDLKCPSCKVFNESVKPHIYDDYIAQGKVALYYVHFPFLYEDSTTAALAAQAVYRQNPDATWKYIDLIFKNQGEVKKVWATTDFLVKLAGEADASLDLEQLRKDIDNQTYAKEVQAQYDLGDKLNIGGTPTLFMNGKEIGEAESEDYSKLQPLIEAELKK